MAKTEGQIKRKRKSAGHTTTSRASAAKSKELSILYQNYLKWKSNFEKYVAPSTSRSISPTTNDMNLKCVIAGRSTTHRKEISLLHISKPWDGCETVKQEYIEERDSDDLQHFNEKSDSDESERPDEENDSHNSEELSIEESDPDEPEESFEEIDSDDSEHYTTASESGEYSVDCFNANTFGDTSYDCEDAHYVTADNFEYIKSHDSNSSDASEEPTDSRESKINLSTYSIICDDEITVLSDVSASKIILSAEDQLSSDSENWVNISNDQHSNDKCDLNQSGHPVEEEDKSEHPIEENYSDNKQHSKEGNSVDDSKHFIEGSNSEHSIEQNDSHDSEESSIEGSDSDEAEQSMEENESHELEQSIKEEDSDDSQHVIAENDSKHSIEGNHSHDSEETSIEGSDSDEAEQSMEENDSHDSEQSFIEEGDMEQSIEESDSNDSEHSMEENESHDSKKSPIKESDLEQSIEENDPYESEVSIEEIDSDDSEHYTTASENGEYGVDWFNANTFANISYDCRDVHYMTGANFEYIKNQENNSSDPSEESTDPSQSKPNLNTPPEVTVRGDLSASKITSSEDQLSSDSEDETSTDLEDNWVNISSDRQLFHLTDNFYDCDMVLKICLLDKPLYEKDVETLLKKYTLKPPDKSSEEHSEKSFEKSSDKPSEEFTENTSEKPSASAENFADGTSENALDKSSEKSLDKLSAKFTENTPEKTSVKSAEQPSQNYSEKPSETLSEKPSEKLAETPSEEDSDLNESFTGLENLYKKSVKHLYFL
ncbi:spore wall protein 2-like [Ceratitis capitata]|uniref:spore wall protein 2-like n=1 Tax=Ceratitis capitata TaxID=7213 RepID=UPI000C6C86CC|nr:spore wall protein 2-like [Ceratitis capitata]